MVKVGRPHGLDGSFYVDAPLEQGETVRIDDKEFTIAERKGTDAKPIIRLEGIDDRNAAEALRGKTVTTGNGERETGNDEWLVDDLVGCTIDGLGTVTDAVTNVDVENKVIEVNREFLGL